MAKNDWIVAGLNNPDFTNADFRNIADMTVDNTQLLSRDDYLKSNFIKENPAFRDNNGKFSEQKFDDYYKQRVQDFGEFQNDDFYQGPALDMFDTDRTAETPVRDIHFDIKRGVNPDRQAIGIEGVNVWSDPEYSRREIAKQNKVFNTSTGQFEDYTVNDHTLVTNPVEWVKDLFRDPLVLATWDSDGSHFDPVTGIEMQHKKGDAKLNDKGTYYYETLGGRSVLGKDVLSVFDTFTVDGQGINKYDFFDSNDIKKSVAGTVAKNVAALLPLFTPAGTIYSVALIAREFGKSLPMLYGMATALTDSETPSWLNTMAAYGSRATTSTSDYAQQNMFSFENFGNLVSDVALQWGQQKAIASAFSKFKTPNKYIEEANENAMALYNAKRATLGDSEELMQACLNKYMPKAQEMASKSGQLGRDMSLAYMAIVSNTDVYSDALDHGTSKAEAAAIALGSTLGMFAVDKYAHLGELFFDDATSDATKAARRALKNEFQQAQAAFNSISQSEAPARTKLLQYMTKAADTSKRVFSQFSEDLKYHTTNLAEKMIGEGLEEVGEEVVADLSKSMYELAGQFGFDTSTKDVGAWDNAFERYTMNFLGGAIGGGVFYGKEVFDGKTFHRPKLDEDIATLIRNGHVDELRQQLATMTKEGKTGNKKLSASEYETTDDGNVVWRTTEDENNSQSQAVANLVADRINSIEEILLANRVNLSDDELFDNMVLSEQRYKRYKGISQLTNYYQDFATTLDGLVNAELSLKRASNTMEGTKDGNPIPNDTALAHLTPEMAQNRAANLEALKQEVENARKKVQDFLAGETSLDYTRKLNFAMDPALHTPFLEVDADSYLQTLYPGKTIDQLTPEEAVQFLSVQWPEYVQTQLKTKLSSAWEKYKTFEATVDPHLDTLSQTVGQYKTWRDQFLNILQSGVFETSDTVTGEDGQPHEVQRINYKSWTDRLDNETDDEYNNRDIRLADDEGNEETDDQFLLRQRARRQKIEAYNDAQDQAWVDRINEELAKVNYEVDPETLRYLKQIMPIRGRLRDIIKRKIKSGTDGIADEALRSSLSTLKPDLSNLEDIITVLKSSRVPSYTEQVNAWYNQNKDTVLNFEESEDEDAETETTLGELLNSLNLTVKDVLEDPLLLSMDHDENPLLEEDEQKVVDLLTSLKAEIGDEADDINVSNLSQFSGVAEQWNATENTIRSIAEDIRRNPLFKFQSTLRATIKNPVGELLTKIAASNGDVLPNISETLNQITDEFENIDDAYQLQLNDAQRETLTKAKNYLNLLKVYMYAASTVPTSKVPVGQNKTINAFAQSHTDKLRSPWQALPEIDADYATLYQKAIDDYVSQIDTWISFSDKNSINKIAKFVRTDQALSKTLWGTLSSLPRDITINDKHYDLLKGLESIDASPLDTELAQVPLYNLERLLHHNIAEVAKEQGVSISKLVKDSNLLETLLPGIKQLQQQRGSEINDSITADKLTDFDKLQYIAALLAEDPAVFYSQLNQRVSANKEIAPITVQELSTRIAQASMSQTFRDIMAHAREIADDSNTPFMSNLTVISGVAGAGKTQVVLNAIDSTIKDSPVLIAGPTATQALALQKSLGRDKSMTFNDLFTAILGQDQWQRIKQEIHKPMPGDARTFKTPYFTRIFGDDGLIHVTLTSDTIKFVTLPEAPKAIYLDEATHLSTVEAEILNEYAKTVGAQVFLCGDNAQLGYSNPENGIQNIDEGAIFAARTPKLTISLRDNNLQKYQNQEVVRQLLETVLQKRMFESEQDYSDYFAAAKNIASKFNFKIYSDTELNGEMITPQLDNSTIAKIKAAQAAGKSVAFIGPQSSAHLAKLRDNGITIPNENILNLATMQGQEFDIVVVDHDFTMPEDMTQMRPFLQELYTLMTRSREATVFIDNGLSQIIGKNVVSKQKSKAPSIKAGVEQLRQQKLAILQNLDLSMPEGTTETTTTPEEAPAVVNPEEDFKDPEDPKGRNSQIDELQKEFAQDQVTQDSEESDDKLPVEITNPDDLGKFPIECYGDQTFLSVNEGENEETRTITDSAGQSHQHLAKVWRVTRPSDQNAELRNLQAILPDGEEAFWYADKIEWQRKLAKVKAAVLYQHPWSDPNNPTAMPLFITDNFNKDDWFAGTYELEIRQPSAQDITPIHSALSESGFDYNGQRIIASIVFKVKNKQGQICKFDLAGINNPNTLIANESRILAGLEDRINKAQSDEVRQKLQQMHDTLHTSAIAYQNWFNEQLAKFNRDGHYSLDVSHAVKLNMTTWFRKRQGQKIRLGGKVNPDNPAQSNIENLMDQNPNMVFSPVYTFTGNEAEFYNLDPALSGKAVVFVTSDTMANPNDLLADYLGQKRNPDGNTPRVRMILLDNYGLSFSQLNDADEIDFIKGNNEERLPFRQNFVGIRMFTSLWNTRASLIQFTRALAQWKSDHNYTDSQVSALIYAQNLQFREQQRVQREGGNFSETVQQQIESIFKNASLSDKAFEDLQQFNNEICKDIPMFRLGYSEKADNGFHIQQYDVKNSRAYDSDIANLCAITPEKAQQFLKMLNAVMAPISPYMGTSAGPVTTQISVLNSLNVELMKDDGNGNKVRWGIDELIDLKDANHRRTLSGLLSRQGSTLIIGKKASVKEKALLDDGNTVAYAEGDYWSVIPRLLSNLVRTVSWYQHNPSAIGGQEPFARISYHTTTGHENTEETQTLQISLADFFGENGVLKNNPDGTLNHSLFDLFNLVFHGTTANIHPNIAQGEKTPMQLTDAYFKQGFLINPDISRKKEGAGALDIVGHSGKNGKMIFFQIATRPELFQVDVDLRSAGLQISLQELLHPTVTQTQEEQPTTTGPTVNPEEVFKTENPEAAQVIATYIDAGNECEYSWDGLDEAVGYFNDVMKQGWLTTLKSSDAQTALQSPYGFYDRRMITYQEYLQRTYPNSVVTVEANDIMVKMSDGKLYRVNHETGNLDLVSDSTPTPKSVSRLENEYEGTTVGEAFMNLINSDEFDELRQDYDISDDTMEAFKRDFQQAIDLGKTLTDSEDQLIASLNALTANDNYQDLLSLVMADERGENLWNIIFENC